MDTDGQTEAMTSTRSQREWLLSQSPHSQNQTVYNCTSFRSNIYYSLCCVLLIGGLVFLTVLLIKVYG